ncbi:Ribonuclease D [Andreprevotia sp. IGB-42]|uniref:3'-5' exonuclease n=1 Tax=Andreprevotia sp. IGB-42 TaxID=2497473 RepID=UPI001357D21A|nr:3'-5' exonuclease [Andreprevotia sp. IGB-42]KAF0815412.1 Ribonuclease D [Andreprevotia sp. IGB-42]
MTAPLQVPSKDAINLLPLYRALDLARITLVNSAETAQAALAELKKHPAVGFDTESRPTFHKDQQSTGPHVLQFSTPEHAFIFQIHQQDSHFAITELLTDAALLKVGFGLGNDLGHILRKLKVQPRGLFDLGREFRKRGYKHEVGARSAVAILFGQRFSKSRHISTSNWAARVLNDKQLIYAANDAYVAIQVFLALAPVDTPDHAAAS